MSVYLKRETDGSGMKEIVIDFKIILYDLNSNFRCMDIVNSACFKETALVGFLQFARWDRPQTVGRVLPQEAIEIRCEMSPSDKMTEDDYQWNQRIDLLTLSRDMSRVFEIGKHSDFVLSCRGFEFPVHRAVLITRSPKFMRDQILIGGGKDLSNIPPVVLWEFLSFLYSGKLHLPRDAFYRKVLAEVAEEFEVEDLVRRIRTFPKAYFSHTFLQSEHKYVSCNSKVLSSNDVEQVPYSYKEVKCDLVYCNELLIGCLVVHDMESGNGDCVKLSFTLKGVLPDYPVLMIAIVHLLKGKLSSYPILQQHEAHHVFESELTWIQTFPIETISIDVGDELCFLFKIELCDGQNINFLRDEDITATDICPIGLDDFRRFSHDFQLLLDNNDFADFTIVCGKETFRAHKVILSARSEVFEKMLEHDTIEKRTSTVKIDDVAPEIMGILLSYIYTGVLDDLSHEEVCDLYEAADKYAILVLKERCHFFLANNLNSVNVADVLHLAWLHFDWSLHCTARDYIEDHDLDVEGFSPESSPQNLSLNYDRKDQQIVNMDLLPG